MRSIMRAGAVLAAILIVVTATTWTIARAAMTGSEKQDVEKVIEEYLLENPEIVERALMALEEKRRMATRGRDSDSIALLQARLDRGDEEIVLGNPEGNVTVIEFFDYNCGYCRRALADMDALMEKDPELRFVMKEFPILSEGSVLAARVSLAVNEIAPDQYLEFHRQLLNTRGEANGENALRIASSLGIDLDRIRELADKDEITEEITEARALAQELQINGTPSYVVGNELVRGAVGYEALKSKIASLRDCGSTVCGN